MKKIVSAALVASLVAGAAFAEVSLKLNSRTRPSLYTMTDTYAENGKTSTILDFSAADHKDDITFTASGDNAGVVAKITLNNSKSTYNGEIATGAMTNGTTGGAIAWSGDYYGWMTWGSFKLTAGALSSRFTNRYNKTLIQEGWTDSTWDINKYGLTNQFIVGTDEKATKFLTIGKTFLFDFNDFGTIAGTRHTGIIGDYTIPIGDDKLLLKAGVFANKFKGVSTDDGFALDSKGSKIDDAKATSDKSYVGAGFAVEADYQSKPVNVQALFKMPTAKAFGFGLYGDIKAVENLTLAAGFTFGMQLDDEKAITYDYTDKIYVIGVDKWMGLAGDLRAYYKVSDQFTAGLIGKFSYFKLDEADDAFNSLELVATAQYKLNDLFAAQLDVLYVNEDLTNVWDAKIGASQLGFRPGIKLSASSKASVTAAFEYTMRLSDGDVADTMSAWNKTVIKVPVIVRVTL